MKKIILASCCLFLTACTETTKVLDKPVLVERAEAVVNPRAEAGLQAGLAVAEQLGGLRRPWRVAEESGRIYVGAAALAAGAL